MNESGSCWSMLLQLLITFCNICNDMFWK